MLVVFRHPSEKWWTSSVGVTIPNRMESHKIHVPNHQPGIYSFWKTKVVLNVRHHFGHQFGWTIKRGYPKMENHFGKPLMVVQCSLVLEYVPIGFTKENYVYWIYSMWLPAMRHGGAIRAAIRCVSLRISPICNKHWEAYKMGPPR